MSKQLGDTQRSATASPPMSFNEQVVDVFSRPDQRNPILLLTGLTLLLVWSYFNTLMQVYHAWRTNDLYSHGYLVPVFALVLLVMRYEPFTKPTMTARWVGLALVGAGLAMRMFGTLTALVTVDMVSFVPTLAGLFLLVGGWNVIKWAGPAVGFLLFMFPLPDFFKRTVLAELLHVAVVCSTFILQTLGIMTHREGNIIYVADQGLNVVEACAGLRMLTIFIAMAVAIVLIVKHPWWDNLIILASAVPIAVIANVIRITITGLLFLVVGDNPDLHHTMHNLSGLLVMMPVGMGLLYLELFILEKLVIEESAPELMAGNLRKQGIPVPGR